MWIHIRKPESQAVENLAQMQMNIHTYIHMPLISCSNWSHSFREHTWTRLPAPGSGEAWPPGSQSFWWESLSSEGIRGQIFTINRLSTPIILDNLITLDINLLSPYERHLSFNAWAWTRRRAYKVTHIYYTPTRKRREFMLRDKDLVSSRGQQATRYQALALKRHKPTTIKLFN